MYGSISQIIESAKEILEITPPEVLSDIMKNGIVLTGGGALIKNIERLFEFQLKVRCVISREPLTDVVTGCSYILQDIEKYKESLVKDTESIKIV
jgi:rod shape-determining protein MreB